MSSMSSSHRCYSQNIPNIHLLQKLIPFTYFWKYHSLRMYCMILCTFFWLSEIIDHKMKPRNKKVIRSSIFDAFYMFLWIKEVRMVSKSQASFHYSEIWLLSSAFVLGSFCWLCEPDSPLNLPGDLGQCRAGGWGLQFPLWLLTITWLFCISSLTPLR